MPYREYLLTPEWRETRNRALARAGWKCALCASRSRLEVHHNTYENLGTEEDTDVTVICHDCHEHFHFGGPGRDLRKNQPQEDSGLIWKIFRSTVSERPLWDAASLKDAVKHQCAKAGLRDYASQVESIWDAVLAEIISPIVEEARRERAVVESVQPFSRGDAASILATLGVPVKAMPFAPYGDPEAMARQLAYRRSLDQEQY